MSRTDIDRAYEIARECTEEAQRERERQQRHSDYLGALDDEAFRAEFGGGDGKRGR